MRNTWLILLIGTIISCASVDEPITQISFMQDEAEKKIEVRLSDTIVTVFHYNDSLKKPILYPVKTANGTIVTRGWPLDPRPNERTDHPHHQGVWFNFGNVNNLDFWNNSYSVSQENREHYGKIVVQSINQVQSEDEKGLIAFTAHWLDADNNVLLIENTRLVFSAAESLWRVDRFTKLQASAVKVAFTDNKEGMFAIRVARELEAPSEKALTVTDEHGKVTEVPVVNNEGVNGVYLGSNGKEGEDVWGTRNKWVILSAEKAGDQISVAIMDHPDNIGFPAYYHARPYGLFSINNLGFHAYNPDEEIFNLELQKGDSLLFRHRMLVKSSGYLTEEMMEEEFTSFSKEKYD